MKEYVIVNTWLCTVHEEVCPCYYLEYLLLVIVPVPHIRRRHFLAETMKIRLELKTFSNMAGKANFRPILGGFWVSDQSETRILICLSN